MYVVQAITEQKRQASQMTRIKPEKGTVKPALACLFYVMPVLLSFQSDFRSFQQGGGETDADAAFLSSGLDVGQQPSVVHTLMVVGIVAHVAVVRAFQP